MEVIWRNHEFEVKLEGEKIVEGCIEESKIKKISSKFVSITKEVLGVDPIGERELIRNSVDIEDQANFVFIRSILDYGGVAPSSVFAERILDLYKKRRFMFRPKDQKWGKISPDYTNLVQILLSPIAGLHRTDFENIAKWWINIRNFLIEKCDGDASNFFERMASEQTIDTVRSNALEKLHRTLVQMKLPFPYGDKNGRLALVMMSKSERGLGLLKGVKYEHLEHFNIPVDSQVIRVSLNSGIIKLEYVKSEELTMLKKKGWGLSIGPFLIEICQEVWKLIAQRLRILPVDLDLYVWSIGTMICKKFGKFCTICPLASICDSVARGYVGESRGVDWPRGCFSMAKPHPTAFGVMRTCHDCPDYQKQRKECDRGDRYQVKKLKNEELKLIRQLHKSI